MPNQLLLDLKTTSPVPIQAALGDYIRSHYTDVHPDAFNWDVKHWEALRADASKDTIQHARVDVLLRYHAQLVFILTKLPPNIALPITYSSALSRSDPMQEASNLVFERAAVLFNLAALYSQLSAAEDRSNTEGLKRAILHAQNSAGTLSYIRSTILPKFRDSLEAGQTIPTDISDSALRSFESLMLAQAQEGVWQRAVLDNLKNGLIAKLAMKASSLYGESATAIINAPSSTKRAFSASWLAHLEVKQLHFEAAAHYRKSVEDLEADRYGHEIAHLELAKGVASKAKDIARRGRVAPAVTQDLQGLIDTIDKNLARAERDNDLIYHYDVPSAASLEPIATVTMAKSTPPGGLLQPQQLLESANEGVILGELIPWGAVEAINVYKDRRSNWIKDEVVDRAAALNTEISSTLQALSLPAALDALDKPIGLPPSLLKKAEEVRLEDGPHRIDVMSRDMQALAASARGLLEQSMDIVDGAIEDGKPPHQGLVAKYHHFQGLLQQAADSDRLTSTKWDDWEEAIVGLTQDEATLEASVPSTTMSAATSNRETKLHARALRRSLEALDDIQRIRADIVRRTNLLADADNIQPRIAREATGVARWAEVTPAMFEDTIQEELVKFDKFRADLELGVEKQTTLLADIKTRHPAFLQSRKEDPAVKEREHALQSLDLAYYKYQEIVEHHKEGLKFYNTLVDLFTDFQRECQAWAMETQAVVAGDSMELAPAPHVPAEHATTATEPTAAARAGTASAPPVATPAGPSVQPQLPSPTKKVMNLPPPPKGMGSAMNLPPPESGDWEAVDFDAFGPSAGVAKTKGKKKKVAQTET